MASTNLDAVSVEIKVAGKVCDYVTMELFQSVSTHHRFKIKVNYRPDKPSVWAIGPDVIFKQLGEKVSIIMTHHESGEKTEQCVPEKNVCQLRHPQDTLFLLTSHFLGIHEYC